MNCKKCGDPINPSNIRRIALLNIFSSMPEDICFECYEEAEIVQMNVKAKTQPMGCPCCETEVKVFLNVDILRATDKVYKITCSKCSIQTASYKTEDEVIAVWNTRPEHKIFRTFAV